MEHKNQVTFSIRVLLNLMRRLHDNRLVMEERITPMQGRVIGYLSHHTQQDVYQRDLEREFQVRRSTASAILRTMERDGLIRRESVPHDARLKKLVLTQRAEAFNDRFHHELARVETLITRDVPQEEMEIFFRVVAKFESNLKQYVDPELAATDGKGGGEEHA